MASEKVLQEKQAFVAELTEKLNGATTGVIVSYSGITVEEDTKLRRELREAGVEYTVVKNTMLKRAAEAANLNGLDDVLHGSTALAICDDYTAAAKILCKYAEDSKTFEVKAGFMDGKVLPLNDVFALAELPSKEALLAQVLGTMLAPITSLAIVLKAIAEKNGAPAEAVAE